MHQDIFYCHILILVDYLIYGMPQQHEVYRCIAGNCYPTKGTQKEKNQLYRIRLCSCTIIILILL